MTRRRSWMVTAGVFVIVVIVGLVVRNQIRVYRNRVLDAVQSGY